MTHSLFLSYAVVGIVTGCLYALTATGLVVTYTTSGIFNFAHGAIGMFMTFTYWQLAVQWHLPVPVAMALVLFILAPLAGALIERVAVRPLYGASLSVTLVVTLGLLLGLLGAADALWKPSVSRHLPALLGNSDVHVFGVAVTYDDLLILAVSVAVAVGLRLLFTQTRLGLTMRAVVDDRDLTARAGASPHRTSQMAWALGASLAALAGILIAPLESLDQFNLTFLVVVGYAAAVVGRLKNLPLTVAGALVLGLVQSYAVGYLPVTLLTNLNPVIPVIVLFGALLTLKQDRLRIAAPAGRRARPPMGFQPSLGLGAGFVALTAVLAGMLSGGNLLIFAQGLALGIVMLSLVLLSGYGGQVSLCQMTLAGFGAFCMGKVGGPLGFLLAALVPAAVGAVLALAVLRLRGLYLALATLAFAQAADALFFNKYLGYGGILHVGRLGAHSLQGFTVEVAAVFAVFAVVVLAIRRRSLGRRLAALNDSEAGCASIGMSITATKVAAFTAGAAIAGVGGALYGGVQGDVGPADFFMLNSLILLLVITLSGIDTVGGGVAAAMFYALQPQIQKLIPIPDVNFLLVGVGAVMLGRQPAGLVGRIFDMADRLRSLRGPIRLIEVRSAELG